MGGLVSITGLADGTVVKCGPIIGDLYGGAVATIGLVSALLHAARAGEGEFVDVAMSDARAQLWRLSVGTVQRILGTNDDAAALVNKHDHVRQIVDQVDRVANRASGP